MNLNKFMQKLRADKFQIDNDKEVKPFFSLEQMTAALFDCAGRLFNVSFTEVKDVQTYHPDVKVYEVRDKLNANQLVSVFIHDNFMRSTKRSGAWMSTFRDQSKIFGENIVPIVINLLENMRENIKHAYIGS